MKAYISALLGTYKYEKPMSWNICQYDECESYTARPDGEFCETHRRSIAKAQVDEIRSAEKRKKLLSKPKKIYAKPNKVSEKRKVLNEEYSLLRDQFLKTHDKCELKLLGCTGTSNEVHHTASGWNKATNLNNVSTWKASCSHCHDVLHSKLSAKEARDRGLKI